MPKTHPPRDPRVADLAVASSRANLGKCDQEADSEEAEVVARSPLMVPACMSFKETACLSWTRTALPFKPRQSFPCLVHRANQATDNLVDRVAAARLEIVAAAVTAALRQKLHRRQQIA